MQKSLGYLFEKAVYLLAKNKTISDEEDKKPALFHDIRVGVYLYEHKYSQDIVLAGLLHDAIEWYGITEDVLRKEFGNNIAKTVIACTKDDSIKDPKEKIEKIILQCVQKGKEALIVKTADIIDSFQWYTSVKNETELKYCHSNADAIFRNKSQDIEDEIFEELRKWHSI